MGLIGLTAITAVAEPYWVSWSGDSSPEEEGWSRTFTDANGVAGQGGAIRTLEGGSLFLDGLRDVDIVDAYEMSRGIDPDPGEVFEIRWGLNFVDIPNSPRMDVGITVFSDQATAIVLRFGASAFRSMFESTEAIPIDMTIRHDFVIRSIDMESYELFIDGAPARSGAFRPTVSNSRVGWGDSVQGVASHSSWDYIEFGVVPEPSTGIVVVVAATIVQTVRRRT